MAHIVNSDREYRLLQQRLDRHITGAPDSPVFMKILRLLFSPEEAKLARQIPTRLTPMDVLVRKLGIQQDELDGKMTEMAERGLILDFVHNGIRYFSLPPVVIGFFEFTFMRTRDDMPMAELARLFDAYMSDDNRFLGSVFKGYTQIGRSLVREEALPERDHTEILDWERASRIVQTASAVGVSLCSCRHKKHHLGKACNRLLRNCLSLNYVAEMLARNGIAELITTVEAMRILEESKAAGLAQTGDNVRHIVTYICNCCGCCCGMIEAIKRFDIRNAIITSNWLAQVDVSNCTGCNKCAEACPVGAIEVVKIEQGKKKRKLAVHEESLCLGCGVCHTACEFNAITMKSRPQRPIVPETAYDRIVAMAIERGKLGTLLFDEPERLSHRALGRLIRILEKSPPYKAAMAIKPLRSSFLNKLVKGAKKSGRERFGDVIG